MRMLKKQECGYADVARLQAGRIVYCTKEEVAYEYGFGQWKRRTLNAVTRPQSDARAGAWVSNLHLR